MPQKTIEVPLSEHALPQPPATRPRERVGTPWLRRAAMLGVVAVLVAGPFPIETLGDTSLRLFGPRQARAQNTADPATRSAARRLGAQGIEAYWANDFATASDKLDRAFQLYATTTLGLWSARARVQLGQLVEGAERYREAIRADVVGDADAQHKAQREAREELDGLVSRIPTLTIHISNARPTDVEVALDGAPIPSALLDEARPTNPGSHEVVAMRGSERQTQQVYLSEGEQKRVSLALRAEPQSSAGLGPDRASGEALALTPIASEPAQTPRAPAAASASASPLKPIGIVTLAFGAAGLATAGITALIANAKRSECPDGVCPPDIKQSYDGLKTVSTVAFYGGAGLALGGLVMWLAAPKPDAPPPAMGWSAGPTGATLYGSF